MFGMIRVASPRRDRYRQLITMSPFKSEPHTLSPAFYPPVIYIVKLSLRTDPNHLVIQAQVVRFYRHGKCLILAEVDTVTGALTLRVAYLSTGTPVITTSVMRLRRL